MSLGDHVVDLSRFLLQDSVTVEVSPQQAVPPPLAAIEDAAGMNVLCLLPYPDHVHLTQGQFELEGLGEGDEDQPLFDRDIADCFHLLERKIDSVRADGTGNRISSRTCFSLKHSSMLETTPNPMTIRRICMHW